MYLKLMAIYPFGEYSILKCDLYQQYINLFCYLKEVILNGKSIIISWNLGLANNFYTTFAYYLISPLNLGVMFFNSSNMDIFIEVITAIKIILMTNFTILFLEKSYNYKKIEVVLFGLIYAYSSYVICYSFHIMWLDCLYMLPIALLFVDKYIKTGKIWPFTISLAYAILTNYYIGYIVAFFAGIYFLARLFIVGIDIDSNGKSNCSITIYIIRILLKFLLGLLIAFGIGMIVILPSLKQLSGKMSADVKLFEIDLEKIRLFINVIFNNYVYMFTQKSCFMFSSTLVILLIPMYYLNKNISKKEKISFSAIIIFLLLPIISPFFNKLWHAFTTPNCFNYRYSFTLIFTLNIMSARQFQNKSFTKKKHFIISFIIFAILTSIEIILNQKGYLESDNYTVTNKSIILSCIIYLTMFVITYITFFVSKESVNKIALCSLIGVVIVDLLIGAKSGQNNNDRYFKREAVVQYDGFMEYFMKKIKVPETERIVFYPDNFGSNMSLKYGYSNIGFFTSARNRENLKSMYRLGYNVQMDEQLWMTSYSGTFLNYSIAGVKYYITKENLEDNEIYGFEFDEKYDDFYIYKNKNNFDIGYYLTENIEESYNPFKMQNDLINNLIKDDEENQYFQNIEKSDILNCTKNIIFDEKTQEYTINYAVRANKDCNIYLASDYNLQLYINGESKFKDYSNIWSTENGIKQIKYLKKDEELQFSIVTKQNLDLLYIYVSDNDKIQNVLDNKSKYNYFYDVKIKNDGLSGKVNFQDDGYLVFSIAYDDLWDVYVDGEKIETEAIAGTFLGVEIEKGVHEVILGT